MAQLPIEKLYDKPDLHGVIQQYILLVLEAHSYSPEFHREILTMTYSDCEIKETLPDFSDSIAF